MTLYYSDRQSYYCRFMLIVICPVLAWNKAEHVISVKLFTLLPLIVIPAPQAAYHA